MTIAGFSGRAVRLATLTVIGLVFAGPAMAGSAPSGSSRALPTSGLTRQNLPNGAIFYSNTSAISGSVTYNTGTISGSASVGSVGSTSIGR